VLYPRYAKGAENVRIDVILVAPWRLPHHLVNVWHG
jgi:putative endonuclease